jgi:hypothetical protein|tara:strand:- start:4132 stop:4269 length:138 start_codon:yes stop_codon:yes gene_type:complete
MPKYKIDISFDTITINADNEEDAKLEAMEAVDFYFAHIDVEEVND